MAVFPTPSMSNAHTYILFIVGQSELSRRARLHFDQFVRAHVEGPIDYREIDVVADPAAAREHRVIATPLLYRVSPGPPVKILGDLSDEQRVRDILGLGSPSVTTTTPSPPPSDSPAPGSPNG